MRVLLVNTTDKGGGAAIAADRLMHALTANGVKAKMLVGRKESNSLSVVGLPSAWRHKAHFVEERLGIWAANGFSREHLWAVDTGSAGTDITRLPEFREADVIHLHWVNQGMVSLGGLRRMLATGKPVVWTLHDMWPFTGICHYTQGCERYREGCHHCPQLRFPRGRDLSYCVFRKKQRIFDRYNVHFVAVSRWLAEWARLSPLMARQEVEVIPNALPVGRFSLQDGVASRRSLGLPEDKTVLVFGAVRIDDPRKGLRYLKAALETLVARQVFARERLCVALFGGVKDSGVLDDFPVEYRHFGYLKDDEELSRLYAAADAAVIPSEYETFGQTVIEAQACGCVPVTFAGSGQEDIVEHRHNGYLAQPRSVEDLADGIAWAVGAQIPPAELRGNVMRRYSEEVVAHQYIALYEKISHQRV
ncbi:MAG: glycosyltransferase family 4 protein [Bacteroidaceae bacterium]|nr:glycosyltransferase family 4 protein [Bacteroidaceae bacterium]